MSASWETLGAARDLSTRLQTGVTALVFGVNAEAIAREAIANKIYQQLQPQYSMDIEVALPKIKVPTLVIWGDKDRVLDVSSAEVFKRLIPQAQLVIFKDVGHAPQMERTKETAIAYQSFLAGVR